MVDGVLLTDAAEELLKKKEILKVPVLMGITNHEFGWILPQVTHMSQRFNSKHSDTINVPTPSFCDNFVTPVVNVGVLV